MSVSVSVEQKSVGIRPVFFPTSMVIRFHKKNKKESLLKLILQKVVTCDTTPPKLHGTQASPPVVLEEIVRHTAKIFLTLNNIQKLKSCFQTILQKNVYE